MGWILVCSSSPPAFAQEIRGRLGALHREGMRLAEAGKYAEGVAVAQQALALAKQQVGEQAPGYATALDDLGCLYLLKGNNAEAGPLLQAALAIRKERLGEQHLDYAASLSNVGDYYKAVGQYAQAEPLYVQALATRKQQLGEHHPDYAAALNSLAELYESMARYAEAEPLHKNALAIRKQQLGGQHLDYAKSLENLAGLYESMGRFALAEPLYKSSLAIKKKQLGEQHVYYADCLNNLAYLYRAMGRYAEAEPLYVQALAIRKQQLGERHPDYASSLNNLASLYRILGRYGQAEPLYLTALAIRKRELGEQHPSYASSLNNLASLYESMGRYAEVEPLYVAALAIKKQQVGEQHPDYANSLNNLAAFYRITGRYALAELLCVQALAIQKKALGTQHPAYATTLNNLAALYTSQGRYTESEPLHQQALAIKKDLLGEQHPGYAKSLNNLAGLYESMGRYAEAQAFNSQATGIVLQHVRGTFQGLSEREKRQFLKTISGSSEMGHSFLAKPLPAASLALGIAHAYDNLLFTKGLLLVATAGMQRRLLASGDTALGRRFGQWQAAKRQLAAASALPLAQQQQRGLLPGPLAEKANELEKELTVRSAIFREGNGLPTATWQQVRQALRPGEAAIELVRHRWFRRKFTDTLYYSAYVVTPGCKVPQLVVLKNGNALEQDYLPAYQRLARLMGSGRGLIEVNTAGAGALADPKLLYAAFWQPIAQALPPGTKTVYFSADGAYQQLNLATLQNPATGQYLLDEVDLRLVGSTRELVRPASAARRLPSGAGSVLVGAPAYRLAAAAPAARATPATETAGIASRSNDILAGGEVPPLPGTAREIAELDAVFAAAGWPRQPYTGVAATEELVRDLHRPRVLHIATHGFFVPAASASAAKGAPDSAKESDTESPTAADPLLRSGLLLAGVSNFRDAKEKPATEDGILTAYEASLLDLQGTELVVLSACETGLGQVQAGEGVYGLQRGFTVAGARSVLMSLWKVDDAVTRELMVAFYRNWLGGQSKRAALLAAQQQVRRQHPDPYYWGAFVLVGE